MNRKLILSLLLLFAISCEKNSDKEKLGKLVRILEEELNPLPEYPLLWSNSDLKFLDPIANKLIIGLGEATHGTAEFFKAKHRIFRYLVENHGYKIFAFEADFGESLLINKAIQKSDSGSIENLMKSKMQFWTWKTKEVKDLLVWMCTYNLNKSDEEKVQYMGIDCQVNIFNSDMVREYLFKTAAPFYSFAESLLNEAKTASKDSFVSYSEVTFNYFIKQFEDLQDSVSAHKTMLIQASSEKQYLLQERILEVVKQVSIQNYYYQKKDYTINYRDKFMAENAVWMSDYFEGKKIVLWAHNAHIAKSSIFFNNSGSLGYYLNLKLNDNYVPIGFLFSKGTFNAVGKEGNQYTGLKTQVLDSDPLENSLNYIMSQCEEPAYSVKISHLTNHQEWFDALCFDNIQYFEIGSAFNYVPQDYYSRFNPAYFNYLIYFDNSTATVILQ